MAHTKHKSTVQYTEQSSLQQTWETWKKEKAGTMWLLSHSSLRDEERLHLQHPVWKQPLSKKLSKTYTILKKYKQTIAPNKN